MTPTVLDVGPPGPDADVEQVSALADAVLMPCFDGVTAPEWLLRRVSGSLGGVCLFSRNIGTPEQVRALTDRAA